MPANVESGLPAYQRILRGIRKQIEKGELKPGDAVSSERELARTHGVSLMTARSALVQLAQQGLVDRRPGAGTFVAKPQVDYNLLTSTTELMRAKGMAVRSRVLSARLVKDEPDIAEQLRLPPGSRLVKLVRLRKVERQELALEASFLSADVFGSLLTRDLNDGSLFVTLEKRFRVELAYADEEVDAAAADKRTAQLLKTTVGAPVLRIRQLIYSVKDEPVLYVLGLYRSDMHRMHIRRLRRTS